MEIVSVDLSEIEFADKSFYIPFKVIPPDLITTIDSIGVINPPLLLSKSNNLIIVTGWKRIYACKQLNKSNLMCKVLREDELSQVSLIRLIYEDNRDRYSDVETGQLASIFLKYQDNIASFLKLIGLPCADKNVERFHTLSRVDERLLDLYLDGKLNPDQLVVLSQIEIADSLELSNRVFIPFRFNVNETREFVRDISDISVRDDISFGKIVDILLNDDENFNKDKIRYKLKKMRYPGLSRAEEEFSELIKKLKLPKNININHSQFFENNFIDILIRISKESQLHELKELLETDYKFQALKELINLVKHGKRD